MRLPLLLAFAATALAAAPTMLAAESKDELAQRLAGDKRVAAYLGIASGETATFDGVEMVDGADFNADGVQDPVVMVRRGKSVAVGAFLGSKDGASSFAGSIRLDAGQLPNALVCDLTGDGASDLRLEFTREDSLSRTIKSVSLGGLIDGAFGERFRGVIDEVERHGIYQRKSEHLMRIEDTDGDAQYEIEVTSRLVELLGQGAAEREIAGSVATTTSIYRLKAGRYELDRVERVLPTDEMRLEAAMELLDAGAVERAAQIAVDISTKGSITTTAVTERAAEILKTVRVSVSPDTVASGKSAEVSPDAPTTESSATRSS